MRTRVLTICAFLMLAVARDAGAAKWTVLNTAASGAGSLEAAVDSANAGLAGVPDTIAFAIPGAGPHIITRSSSLSINAPAVLIDGYTQPGSSVNTLPTGDNAVLKIVLTSSILGPDAFQVFGDSCRIRGLVIGGNWGNGIVVLGGSNHVIEGNFIGVDAAGTSVLSNSTAINMSAAFNRIGGTTPSARNVIAGSTNFGILVSAPGASGSILGNYIGTNKNGTSALGNNIGVYLGTPPGCNVGGSAAGSGNLISGNQYGIYLGPGTSGNTVQGNLIGTTASGMSPLGNSGNAVYIADCPNNQIGGSTAAERNVISASVGSNIYAYGDNAFHNVIQGNYIGTDQTGLAVFSNGVGIVFYGADSNQIGGAVPGQRNVIAGHAATAIHLEDTADFNTISGNYIGVGSDGVTALSNGLGIDVQGGRNNLIGGPGANQGNIIAHSAGGGDVGVRVINFSTGNRIRRNSIYSNASLGIDLVGDGVTANDPLDVDGGPNALQNFPALTSVANTDTGVVVNGSLSTLSGPASYLIDVYQSASCDATSNGEGEEWLDSFTVVAAPVTGFVAFSHNLGLGADGGKVLTATATSPSGSTSEFSICTIVPPAAVEDTLRMFLFSPVSMVVTDPVGDSIGVDSASHVIFNTILNSSTYDTLTDVNSPGLTGPDGSKDDIVTIAHPYAGQYQIRMFVSDTTGSTSFTMSIRIDGNQMLVPDDYHNQSIDALGTTVDPVFTWVAATTLPGDANADGKFTSADIIYLVNYVFKGGPTTPVPDHGDVNCSGAVTSADIINLVNFIFKGGLPPCSQSGG